MMQMQERSEAVAHLKFARVGPRKLRRVADAIRGKTVREALVLLQFAGVFAAEPIEKLLKSAVANAENNHNMDTDGLFVTRITVDGGPGGGFTKRMSHVTIAVGATPPKHQPRGRAGAAVALSTLDSRQAKAASAKPAATRTSQRKKPAPGAGA
jgi:large subunit ribosomal protein L22